jgi:hypothetical protein
MKVGIFDTDVPLLNDRHKPLPFLDMRFLGYDVESLGKRSGLETSRTNYTARGRRIPEEGIPELHQCKNLKTHSFLFLSSLLLGFG